MSDDFTETLLECGPTPNLTVACMLQFRPRLRRIGWPWKPTPTIKHQVGNCHTAEVISIRTFICPSLREQLISAVGGEPHHVWCGRCGLATDWPHCLRSPDFLCIMECWGSKCWLWVHNWQKLFFCPSNFVGGTYESPIGNNQFQNIPHRVAKFCKNWFRDVEKSVSGKRSKITRVKYNSLHND